MKIDAQYYNQDLSTPYLGVDVFFRNYHTKGEMFKLHWHEYMQIYLFTEGAALVECNKIPYHVQSNDIIIVNPNELHYLESLTDELTFYTLRINIEFLFGNQLDLCQTKYLTPLLHNQILFQHLIQDNPPILECLTHIINEFYTQCIGYELAIKSSIYQLMTYLLRTSIQRFLTPAELSIKTYNLQRFDLIFKYIEVHYTSKITTQELADLIHISPYYLCRLFKKIIGQTSTDYINHFRLNKAAECLRNSSLNITEIALQCGFDNINYFSRLFKKQYHLTPTCFRSIYKKNS